MDVIAHILHDLKCRLLTALEDEGEELTSSDIDWVITMPAMKEPKEEKMMREAGYKVSLNIFTGRISYLGTVSPIWL